MPSSKVSRLKRLQSSKAQEFPVLRLMLEDTEGQIQRMTLLSTRNAASEKLGTPESLVHLQALARLADLELLQVHTLSHLHTELRSHPPAEPPGAELYGLV